MNYFANQCKKIINNIDVNDHDLSVGSSNTVHCKSTKKLQTVEFWINGGKNVNCKL